MFNKKEKQFEELLDEAEKVATEIKAGNTLVLAKNPFSLELGFIIAATTPEAWVAAVKAALEALAAKLFGSGDRPKWTKIAGSIVDIAAFVVAMIRSLKSLKK